MRDYSRRGLDFDKDHLAVRFTEPEQVGETGRKSRVKKSAVGRFYLADIRAEDYRVGRERFAYVVLDYVFGGQFITSHNRRINAVFVQPFFK